MSDTTQYDDAVMENDRLRGFADGENHRACRWGDSFFVSAYLTGYDQGVEARAKKINAKRCEALVAARAQKAAGGAQ